MWKRSKIMPWDWDAEKLRRLIYHRVFILAHGRRWFLPPTPEGSAYWLPSTNVSGARGGWLDSGEATVCVRGRERLRLRARTEEKRWPATFQYGRREGMRSSVGAECRLWPRVIDCSYMSTIRFQVDTVFTCLAPRADILYRWSMVSMSS